MLHSGKIDVCWYDAIRKYGWVGVDVFIFLSAIGLCYSLDGGGNLHSFYKRRIKRILPTWFVVLICVHLMGLVCNVYLPSLPFRVPHSLLQCLCWYTGLGYWISDFVSSPLMYYYEWYVPSLLLFYAIIPFVYKRNSVLLIILLVLSVILSQSFLSFKFLYSLHFFYQRIPVFIMGIIYYKMIKNKWSNSHNIIICSAIVGTIGLILCFSNNIKPIHAFQLVLPLGCILFAYIIKQLHLVNFFSFYGGISLELYLVHLYKRPQYLISFICENKTLIVIFTLIMCTLAALCLQKLIRLITAIVQNRFLT